MSTLSMKDSYLDMDRGNRLRPISPKENSLVSIHSRLSARHVLRFSARIDLHEKCASLTAPDDTKMRRNAVATRKKILNAAYRLLYRRGFARVSMDDIAESARITKRSLYYHFKSKDQLVEAVLEDQQ